MIMYTFFFYMDVVYMNVNVPLWLITVYVPLRVCVLEIRLFSGMIFLTKIQADKEA